MSDETLFPMMPSEELVELIRETLDDKKGEDIVVMDLRERSVFTDYFVICTGRSTTHVASLADAVDQLASKPGVEVIGVEGLPEAQWVLLDFGDVLAHIFLAEQREYYALEKLWDDAHDAPDEEILERVMKRESATS
ncbi:ribosome silencing factor [Magnetofaba australis]|uniref:Ribosomal silencing factor RsfS n=1 Tax=Magnetofaba australis IT-1 TaxID=1434232 RepID=A0A1Y2K378_9PROT|nr:ribosome silencing factor [Magnetofaba australis]OSM01614.1 putative ribosome-associated protein [Magnetofaba australis IT-1]